MVVGQTATAPPQFNPKIDPDDEKLVKEVWQRLIAVLDVQRPEGFDIWPPVLDPIDASSEVNAYATCRETEDGKIEPYVRVLQGWVKEIAQGDADRMAFVLSHELGHHVHRHTVKKAAGEGTLTVRTFTREQEEQADTFGAQLVLKAGFSLRGAIDSWKRFVQLDLEYSSFEGKGNTHPSWTERMKRIDQGDRAPLWESMIAFRNGVFLLQVEQYYLAEKCFTQVTEEFPECYEAWANLGFAQLMQYCDKMEIKDLRNYNLGQLASALFTAGRRVLSRRFAASTLTCGGMPSARFARHSLSTEILSFPKSTSAWPTC